MRQFPSDLSDKCFVLKFVMSILLGITVGDCFGQSPTVRSAGAGSSFINIMSGYVPNLGQWNHKARYMTRGGGITVFLQDCGWTMVIAEKKVDDSAKGRGSHFLSYTEPDKGVAIGMRFENIIGPAELSGQNRLDTVHNFFLGSDPNRWRSQIPEFRAIEYFGMYEGTSIRTLKRNGAFDYELRLAPEISLSRIKVRVTGADSLRIADDGSLIIETPLGEIRQHPPIAWEESRDGGKSMLACSVALLDSDVFGFQVPDWNGKASLVIDPPITFSTFFHNSAITRVLSIPNEELILGGFIGPLYLPTSTGVFQPKFGGGLIDGFFVKMDKAGKPAWATYLGGYGDDSVFDMVSDSKGTITAIGNTLSPDFPVTPTAYIGKKIGNSDAFITLLDKNGSRLTYSTYFGGAGDDFPCLTTAMGLDKNGVVYFGGTTNSINLPTTNNAYCTSYNGHPPGSFFGDCFVAVIDPSLAVANQLVYSTYIGGKGFEKAHGFGLGQNGRCYITGETNSNGFPTTPRAFDRTYNKRPNLFYEGEVDGFIACLDPKAVKAQQLVFSSFLGGSQIYTTCIPYGLAIDPQSQLIALTGTTHSADFPTTKGCWMPNKLSPSYYNQIGFITILNPSGSYLVASTFFSGKQPCLCNNITWLPDRSLAVIGTFMSNCPPPSNDLPITSGAFQVVDKGKTELFVARLDSHLSRVLYCSYLSSSEIERRPAINSDLSGFVLATGYAGKGDFPVTPGAYITKAPSGGSPFIVRIPTEPIGVKRIGYPTQGCDGMPTAFALARPISPSSNFGFECWQAPPGGIGILFLGKQVLSQGFVFAGIDFWLDPNGSLFSLSVFADKEGKGRLQLPLPVGLGGAKLYVQFFWLENQTCGVNQGISCSEALEVQVQ